MEGTFIVTSSAAAAAENDRMPEYASRALAVQDPRETAPGEMPNPTEIVRAPAAAAPRF